MRSRASAVAENKRATHVHNELNKYLLNFSRCRNIFGINMEVKDAFHQLRISRYLFLCAKEFIALQITVTLTLYEADKLKINCYVKERQIKNCLCIYTGTTSFLSILVK